MPEIDAALIASAQEEVPDTARLRFGGTATKLRPHIILTIGNALNGVPNGRRAGSAGSRS